jgi:hypothetical protein
MAGLAPHPTNFFKFLLILVLFTIAMTIFVRSFPSPRLFIKPILTPVRPAEFPTRSIYIQRRSRPPARRADWAIPNDVCGVLRPPQLDPASAAVATVDVPAQVCARGARGQRGQLGARDTGYPSRRARDRLCCAHHEPRALLSLVIKSFL